MTDNRMISNHTAYEALEKMLTQLGLEDFLSHASQVMETYEMFDRAVERGTDYGQGYQDGFWAGRELDVKYQWAKLESIAGMISKL